MNTTGQKLDLHMVRGAVFNFSPPNSYLLDSSGALRNFSGYSGRCFVLDRWGSNLLLASLNTNLSGASGAPILSLAVSGTRLLPTTRGVYSFDILSGSYIEQILYGSVLIEAGTALPATGDFATLGGGEGGGDTVLDWERDENGDWQPIY